MPAGQLTCASSANPGWNRLAGTAGDLTTLLDQILVNGNTAQSVTSITRSGAVATVTTAAHGFNITNGIGQYFYVTIAGATQTDYNGTFLCQATSSTTFTYTVANSPSTPATGTITWQIPGAGWTIAYTGTNKRVYYNGSAAISRRYLRVNDSAAGTGGAKEALVRGFTTIGDIDAVSNTGPFPTAAQSALTQSSLVWRKSATADTTTRSWVVSFDDRMIQLFIISGDTAATYAPYTFGEYTSDIASDATASMISGGSTENTAILSANSGGALYTYSNGSTVAVGLNPSCYTCGDNSGFNNSTGFGVSGDSFSNSFATAGSLSGPVAWQNPGNAGFYSAEFKMYRNNSSTPAMIGRVRGVRYPLHGTGNFTDGDIYGGASELAGRQFRIIKTVNSAGCTGVVMLETTNPDTSV